MKKYGSFVAGMVAMLMVVSSVGSVSAASSRVEYNKAGISLFGEDKVLSGESYKAPNGQEVPSVITYVMSPGARPITSPSARSPNCWASKFAGMGRKTGSISEQTPQIMWS